MHAIMEGLVLCYKVFVLYLEALYCILFPPEPKDILGEIVLVTGAGHGIGRELALEFSKHGTTLVLWDINKENNESTAKEIKDLGGVAYPYTCNISNSAEVHKVAEKVRQDVGEVTVLVNNAGVLMGGALLDLQEKDIRRTFNINIFAQFWTVREFLPSMMTNNHGYIMNIASSAAKSGTAFLVDYSSSKYAVFGFTEALKEELERLGKTGIKTTVVCPLFVDTGLTKFPKVKSNTILTAKETAWNAVDGMLRGESVVYVPRNLWISIKLGGLLPLKAVALLKKFQDMGIDPQYEPESTKSD